MYAVDPVSGNTTGFQPSSLLGPKDAFELYDKNHSGDVDEDEFALVLVDWRLDALSVGV
jgi:Ca2+-binding EF-hand superfamily protein